MRKVQEQGFPPEPRARIKGFWQGLKMGLKGQNHVFILYLDFFYTF